MEGGLVGLRWSQKRRRRRQERDPLLFVSAWLPTLLDSLHHLHRRYHPRFRHG